MRKIYLMGASLLLLAGCQEKVGKLGPVTTSFTEISSVEIGGETAAEISAFDPATNQLFVVNNDGGSRVDVIDFSNPENMVQLTSIDISLYGGGLNSVAVKNGKLAIAVEADPKTDPGVVLVYNTADLTTPIAIVPVGALPDMVTFSPDGNLIVSANEGEPNSDYSIDPEGSISIIEVNNGYAVTTLGFEAFESQKAALMANGLRIFGPGASFTQDIEPEYVTVDASSSFAWVTLQENNGMARVDLKRKVITDIFPFGVKDHSRGNNKLDVSDKDGIAGNLQNWPLLSYFLPDAISSFEVGGNTFVITANEGDTRDYGAAYNEESRVKELVLDPTAFPNAEFLQKDENLGRYTVTNAAGDTDGDGDFDVLYGIGGRSFSIWNGRNGQLVRDYLDLERDLLMANSSLYPDSRSDNKGVEPESVEIGQIRGKNIVFVGLERADAIMVYELDGASGLRFLQVLDGKSMGGPGHDAPEGLLFISEDQSPNGRPLLVVSSEGDGRITVYMN